MKPEAQRIAIAKACGWQEFHYHNGKLYGRESCWASGSGGPVPDYLNDLNAMHEAEKTLTEAQLDTYAQHVYTLVARDNPVRRYGIHATAAQRAEAFLRTIGKWQD